MRIRFGLPGMCAAIAFTAVASAADPTTHSDQITVNILKDIHNRGAELYNRGDAAACYRMYEGGLVAVRPFLAHHPAVQAVIDGGLADAAGETNVRAQAFRLHEAIEKVRAMLKDEISKSTATPIPTPKVAPKKSELPTSPQVSPKPAGGALQGVVTLDGKPSDKVTLMIVSLTLKEPRVFTAEVQDGKYTIAGPVPAGQYAVRVEGSGLPAKYQELGSSGLRLEVKDGGGTFDLSLQSK